ncbi:hypothetical protein ACFFMR_25975 [Micromonospora andamanensis]|uniref:hypothetical protein n=1 Tax=Micromonospora andamanensis TaxID=1287068 RepID=UPI0035EC20DF
MRGDSFAYLAWRPAEGDSGAELGARAFGAHGTDAAAAMTEQIRAWHQKARRRPAPTFAYWPAGTCAGSVPANVAALTKTYGLVTISWPVAS